MKATAHKIDNSSVTVDAERLLLAGANYDTVLAFLRDHGFGKLDSIKFLCNAAKTDLKRRQTVSSRQRSVEGHLYSAMSACMTR